MDRVISKTVKDSRKTKAACTEPVEVKPVVEEEDDFHKYLREECEKNPNFKKLWEDSELFRETGIAVAVARNDAGMTQRDLSAQTGITQGDICKIERGNGNPSLKTLKRLADALGCKVKITFEKVSQN